MFMRISVARPRQPKTRHDFFLRLGPRAAAAFRAISLRRSGERAAARAGPPFKPPSLPSATAALFFGALRTSSRLMISSRTECADSTGSLPVLRFPMPERINPERSSCCYKLPVKLTHYPLIARWQQQLSRRALTSLETSAVEAAAELHGYTRLLFDYMIQMSKECCLDADSLGTRGCDVHGNTQEK